MITTLVVGGGSIGKRHLKNLLASGRSAGVVEVLSGLNEKDEVVIRTVQHRVKRW